MTDYNSDRQSGWRFSFWPVVAFTCLLPLLIALGVWQVQRGVEKRQVYDSFEAGDRQQVLHANDLSLEELNALPAYSVVSLTGRYLPERQMLLDNMPRGGRPGHHVFTPFVPEGKDYAIVVDRGWRPGIASDARNNIAVSTGQRTVTGRLAALPRPALRLDTPSAAGAWPRVVQFPDAGQLAKMLDQPVAKVRLLLASDSADGFERDWSAPGIPPERHYAYAAQWFGLALATLVIFLLLARPKKKEHSRK